MTSRPNFKAIAVYCGSNTGAGGVYLDAAGALGAEMAAQGLATVYGGTHKGLMGVLADSALAHGGEVHGVISQRLHDKGHLHEGLTRSEITPTMKERKARMVELADAFIALPGGIGTLEEFMEVWTLNQLGEINKPCGLLSVGGYYEPFMAFVDHIIDQKFLPAAHRNSIVVADNPKDLIARLQDFEPVTVPKWM
ncbi:MAG: TIGR00730 family Rossman fold protein [Pseudomonadota bacterium]